MGKELGEFSSENQVIWLLMLLLDDYSQLQYGIFSIGVGISIINISWCLIEKIIGQVNCATDYINTGIQFRYDFT